MSDLSPYEIEQRLNILYNELGQVREGLNKCAEDFQVAAQKFKREYAKAFITEKLKGITVKEAEMKAQQQTAGLEAEYKASEQIVINERKAVDALMAQVDITRSLYSRATREEEQYRRGAGS